MDTIEGLALIATFIGFLTIFAMWVSLWDNVWRVSVEPTRASIYGPASSPHQKPQIPLLSARGRTIAQWSSRSVLMNPNVGLPETCVQHESRPACRRAALQYKRSSLDPLVRITATGPIVRGDFDRLAALVERLPQSVGAPIQDWASTRRSIDVNRLQRVGCLRSGWCGGWRGNARARMSLGSICVSKPTGCTSPIACASAVAPGRTLRRPSASFTRLVALVARGPISSALAWSTASPAGGGSPSYMVRVGISCAGIAIA
jgi:hypothetical protein